MLIFIFFTFTQPKILLMKRIFILFFSLTFLISNANDLKQLWLDRKTIHLHLLEETQDVSFSDKKYIHWHNSMSILIKELNHGI